MVRQAHHERIPKAHHDGFRRLIRHPLSKMFRQSASTVRSEVIGLLNQRADYSLRRRRSPGQVESPVLQAYALRHPWPRPASSRIGLRELPLER